MVVLGNGRLFGKDLSCAAADGITEQEAVWANEVADLLDATIADRAATAGSPYHPTRSGYANGLAPAVRAVIG